MKQVVIVDYGTGNVQSVGRMLSGLGFKWTHTKDHAQIKDATHLVLPGVGHCARAMQSLKSSGLMNILHERVMEEAVPTLGICLGMQLMTRSSEEGSTECMGWFDLETKEIQPSDRKKYKVPNIGWHLLESRDESLCRGIVLAEQPMYFCHRFAVTATHCADITAKFNYESDYVAILRRKNLIGVQFHPEKSQTSGRILMENFLTLGRSSV